MIDIIMDQLGKNYNCIINKLYASDFEVPQNRRRVIIIGVRKDLNIFPKEIKIVLEQRNCFHAFKSDLAIKCNDTEVVHVPPTVEEVDVPT